MNTVLSVLCHHCDNGVRWISRYGGNDPDVWSVRCEECGGTGERTLHCEAWRCNVEAVEMIDGAPYCQLHTAEIKAELLADLADRMGLERRE